MDNKEVILQVALDLFHAKGYDAVGIQEIVDKAGVTKPTLYYYFGSKKGLLQYLLESGYKILQEDVAEVVKIEAELPEILYQIARKFFNFASAHEKFYLFMLSLFYSGRENEAFQMVLPFIENYYGYIADIFEKDTSLKGNQSQRRMYAVGFTGVLNHHIMTASYGLLENEMFEISDETTHEVVRQFLYGIYA